MAIQDAKHRDAPPKSRMAASEKSSKLRFDDFSPLPHSKAEQQK